MQSYKTNHKCVEQKKPSATYQPARQYRNVSSTKVSQWFPKRVAFGLSNSIGATNHCFAVVQLVFVAALPLKRFPAFHVQREFLKFWKFPYLRRTSREVP